MRKLKILFWILLVFLAGVFIYKALFQTPLAREQFLDPAKRQVQSLLTRMVEKIPKEISVELGPLVEPVLEESYSSLKERDLFSRYPPREKAPEIGSEKKAPPTLPKKEPPKAAFSYKGTLKLGVRQVVILQEESGRSYFVGKGDRLVVQEGTVEYEVVDLTTDGVVLLNLNTQPPEQVVIQRK